MLENLLEKFGIFQIEKGVYQEQIKLKADSH